MADPTSLNGMTTDNRQELKEAVCDAVLERIRQVVSGTGDNGLVILGAKPSQLLASGFVLPRINADGDDETSDIRIATHGLDCRIIDGTGQIRIQLSCSIYVRVLPTSDELFARDGRLLPKTEFNQNSKRDFNQRVRNAIAIEIPRDTPKAERTTRRAAIVARIYGEMGVVIPTGAAVLIGVAAEDENGSDEEAANGPATQQVEHGRLRIPSAHSRQYDMPQKWRRLAIEIPALDLSLPCDPGAWSVLSTAHAGSIGTAIDRAVADWLATSEGQRDAWRKIRPPSEAFWEPAAWDAFLATVRLTPPNPADLIPPIQAQILAQALPEPLAPGVYSVRLALENTREGNEDVEWGLFGVEMTIDIPATALKLLRLERVKRSYHLAGFMTMPAIGVNCGVQDLGEGAGFRHLRTTFMPRYVLRRMQAKTLSNLQTSYAALASAATDVSQLEHLPDAMRAWLDEIATSTPMSSPEEYVDAADEAAQRSRFEGDLAAWHVEAARIRKGVELIIQSRADFQVNPSSALASPYRAWLLLNQAFANANPPREDNPSPGWRLFQIAFVLAHVPTLASRVPGLEGHFDATFDEDSASLLYMSTGGGKTEAFFGIIVFALFLDRLRGKKRGVTTMMHYPLRLLTVQQAQRLARLLAQAELIRRSSDLEGAAFEIGFWVGGGNTPNRTEIKPGQLDQTLACIPVWSDPAAQNEQTLIDANRAYASAKEAWNKIPNCPFCGGESTTALRRFPELHQALGIVCLEQSCSWNRVTRRPGHSAPVPLPFWVVDTDIYRRAPSVLLGTIDKLALLGQNTTTISRIAQMFGLARWREGGPDGLFFEPSADKVADLPPAGTDRVAPAYSGGVEAFLDPFPSLIVQDEMHLLEESLGTFGGLFETGLFAWLRRLAALLGQRASRIPGAPDEPRLPHVIGATATASDAAKHVLGIYQKAVVQFPHPGPGLHDGFYVGLARYGDDGEAAAARGTPNTQKEREVAAPWGRIYASLMTNGRKHTVTTLAVLATQATTVTRWQRDLGSNDVARQTRAANEMLACVSSAPWAARRRNAIQMTAAAGRYDRLAALLDLHRIMLTYVTNKKGGDQILSALDAEARESHAAMGPDYEIDSFEMTLISGGVDIGTIQAVIRAAERAFDPMADNISDALRTIVATSAISHGVDVEHFNAMAFAGMPSDIAEYIQASSRVGRAHVGFSLLIPTPQTRRDRFVLEVHEAFHRLLERMIAPPAIERWADRALKRTLPSLLQMWLAGVYYQSEFTGLADDRKRDAPLPDRVETVERILRDSGKMSDCVAFARNAIGTQRPAAEGGPVFPDYYRNLVLDELRKIAAKIDSSQFAGRLADIWNNRHSGLTAPMTSLRDVDEPGIIRPSDRSPSGRGQSEEDVANVMAILRNRGVLRPRRGALSETDPDTDTRGRND